jgi:hypothetical protein
MTKTDVTSLETTFVTEEQTTTLLRKVDLSLKQLDEVAGGDCSCVNCCSHSSFKAASIRNISLPILNSRARF